MIDRFCRSNSIELVHYLYSLKSPTINKNTKFFHNLLHKNANIHCAKESKNDLWFEKLYLEDKICYQLLLLDRVQLLYVKDSQPTENVLFKGHANKYFSRLCSRNDAICLNCYTRMSNLLIYKVRKIYTIYYIFPRDFSTTFTSFIRY